MKDPAHGSREVVHYSTLRMTYVVVNGYCTNVLDPAGSLIRNHPMLGAHLEGSASAHTLATAREIALGQRLKFMEGHVTWFTDPVTDIIRYIEPKRDHSSGAQPAVTAKIDSRALAS